ncbi:hypothetical protein ICG_05980 [Bacillus cereus BAG1X1-3]|nr:hypothetical protein ICG_05980 [Bacillus cereus BAG1X1-3]
MENRLAIRNPELAKQWHETKNGKLTPFQVTVGSNKRAWWKCKEGHEWETTVHQSGLGKNCPFCKPRASFPEQTIFYFINNRFKNTLSQHLTEVSYKGLMLSAS